MFIARLAQPKFLLPLFLTAFFGTLAAGWGQIGLSDQELLANYAKAIDYAKGFQGAGGWPWWTSSFNSGQTQAPVLGTIFTYLPLILFSPLGPWVGSKAVILIFGAASGLAMYAFARNLTRSEWTAFACAVLYVLCPQFALRAAWNEHVVVALCFLYPPLLCSALLRLSRCASMGGSLVLAVAMAAMFLTYVKMALVFLPALLLFAIWLSFNPDTKKITFWKSIFTAIGFFIPLGLIPLLPALRETQGMTLFEFDPLSGWKRSFIVHTPMSWVDRGGWVLQGLPGDLALDKAGTYVGLITILGLSWILFHRPEWCRKSPEAGPLRIFFAMALFLFWFSTGTNGVALEHWRLLSYAQGLRDWIIPLFWIAFILPCILIFKFWPWPRRGFGLLFLVLTVLVFYFVPGFRVFELVSRVDDIRAPWSFWQVGGSFAIAMVGGLSLPPLFQALQSRREQVGLGIVLIALALLDSSVYEREFFKKGLDPQVAEDFRATEEYLAQAPVQGAVFTFSGRYFYLMTPSMSGRTVPMEAFQGYLESHHTKRLHEAISEGRALLQGFLNVGGIGYVLLDKSDPDEGDEAEKFFRASLPVGFENKNFIVFENRKSLAPAFFSAQAIAFPDRDGFEKEVLSKAGSRNFLSISSDDNIRDLPGIVGKLIETGTQKTEIQMEDDFRLTNGEAFRVIGTEAEKSADPNRIVVSGSVDAPGWVTVPVSYHRDWQAELNGKPVTIYRGMAAFLSVPVEAGGQKLEFFFRPPFWYPLCAWGAALAWLLVAVILGLAFLFEKTRIRLFGTERNEAGGAVADRLRPAVKNSLVVVPCYNEAVSIDEILRQILANEGVEILVVDDGSPDGTAGIVEALPEFGKRIHLLKRPGKLGLASAYKDGFAWALARDFDAVLEIDADLSHNPADIVKLIEALNEGADLAVGSRYLNGIRVLNWAKHRLFLSLFAGVYTRAFTGLPLTDPTSGFKAIRKELLEALDWKRFEAEGYGFQIELHFFAWQKGFVLKEVPIIFTERRAGASKMSWEIAWEAVGRVPRLAMSKREEIQR